MSPSAAIEDTVFRTYLVLAIVLLVVGGIVIGGMRVLSRRNIGHAWSSYCGWLLMVPTVFAAIFAGRYTSILFFGVLSLGGFWEYARATGLFRDRLIMLVVSVAIGAVTATAFLSDPRQGTSGWYGLFMAIPVYAIAAILLVPIIRDRSAGYLTLIALSIVGFVYIGWMFGHLGFLCNAEHAYGYVLYLLFAVEINDVAAFTTGRLIGRHKMRPHISPQKTWEGACGALIVSLALPWLLRFSFPHFHRIDLVAIGLIVGIGGQLGDLTISVIKRDLQIKDMGHLIRGHGGILDRIDSMIFVAPLFFHWVRFWHDI